MNPISIEDFAKDFVKANKDFSIEQIIKKLSIAVEGKMNGAKCLVCGEPIWAIGSAITGVERCFTCTTGSADSSDDYEIDCVCIN